MIRVIEMIWKVDGSPDVTEVYTQLRNETATAEEIKKYIDNDDDAKYYKYTYHMNGYVDMGNDIEQWATSNVETISEYSDFEYKILKEWNIDLTALKHLQVAQKDYANQENFYALVFGGKTLNDITDVLTSLGITYDLDITDIVENGVNGINVCVSRHITDEEFKRYF